MTNLTLLDLDRDLCWDFGEHLGALCQLQDLSLGFDIRQPIIVSDAARLTSLYTFVGETTVLTLQ